MRSQLQIKYAHASLCDTCKGNKCCFCNKCLNEDLRGDAILKESSRKIYTFCTSLCFERFHERLGPFSDPKWHPEPPTRERTSSCDLPNTTTTTNPASTPTESPQPTKTSPLSSDQAKEFGILIKLTMNVEIEKNGQLWNLTKSVQPISWERLNELDKLLTKDSCSDKVV